MTDFGIARAGREPDDGSRLDHRHGAVPVAGAGEGRARRPDLRPVLGRRRPLRAAYRVVPFTGDTPVEIAMKHLSAFPEPPSANRAEIPRDLDMVVMRALAKEPSRALPERGGDGRRPPPRQPAAAASPRRPRRPPPRSSPPAAVPPGRRPRSRHATPDRRPYAPPCRPTTTTTSRAAARSGRGSSRCCSSTAALVGGTSSTRRSRISSTARRT